MPEPASDFAALLGRARQGDRAALSELAQTYQRELGIVAHVRLGAALRPYLDPQDLVQSVHHSLLVGLRQDKFNISSPENLLALALTLLRRKLARKWRRLRRQQRLSHGAADTSNLPMLLTTLATAEPDPARLAQINDGVQRLCQSLSESERRLLELRLLGYTTTEVARELREDVDLLYVRLSRLRRRLRESGLLSDGI